MTDSHIYVCAVCGRTLGSENDLAKLNRDYVARFNRPPATNVVRRVCEDCMGWMYVGDTAELNPEHRGVMPPWTIAGRTLVDVLAEAMAGSFATKN